MRVYLFLIFCLLIGKSLQQSAAETTTLNSIYTNMGGSNWISTQRSSFVGASYDVRWGSGGNTAAACGSSGSNYFNAWFGVICTYPGGSTTPYVTSLLLPGNNLIGSLPSLTGLTAIQKLFLFNNKISGALPNLAWSSTLTHLYIFGNQLTDVSGVSGATKLTKFFFDNNFVTTSINSFLPNLIALQEIDGTTNQMTGTINSNIATTNPALTNIKLGFNKLSGTFPNTLLTHPKLLFIRFNNNLFTGSVPSTKPANQVQVFNASYNGLTCALPPWVSTTFNVQIDLRGQTFLCPITVPSNVLVDYSTGGACASISQSGIAPTSYNNSGPQGGNININGNGFSVCSSAYQCGFTLPGTGTYVFTASNFINNTQVRCPFPTFSIGGLYSVCLSLYDTVVSASCNTVRVFYDCNSICQPNGVCDDKTGKCFCKVGFTGPTCKLLDCGNCNNGTCNTTTGKCQCNPGFLGPYCNFGNISCAPKFNCSNGGQCDGFTGTCQCKLGWQGPNCTDIFCPPCDSRGGICVNGTCICSGNWTGPLCNIPTGNCSGNCFSNESRGLCDKINAKCNCFLPYTGDNCQFKTCPLNCSYPHGVCDLNTGECTCIGNYTGYGCYLINLPCPNNCSGNGLCIPTTGQCLCSDPYQAPDCLLANCPLNCSWHANATLSHGTCNRNSGKCNCRYPYAGAACANGNLTCPNNCSGRGSCDKTTGNCTCNGVNFNEDCSARVCKPPCANGTCDPVSGICNCNKNYAGPTCSTINIPCLDNSCSNNGVCNTTVGNCICRSGWGGVNCSFKTCPRNCSYPNGTCDVQTGKCQCGIVDFVAFTGIDCSLVACPGDCINNGSCNSYVGTCACQPGYSGATCSLIACPNDCSGNGRCAGGVCFCNEGWSGNGCQTQKPNVGLIVGLAIGLFLAGLALIIGGFFLWRYLTIQQLKKELDNMQDGNNDQQLDEISSGDSDG